MKRAKIVILFTLTRNFQSAILFSKSYARDCRGGKNEVWTVSHRIDLASVNFYRAFFVLVSSKENGFKYLNMSVTDVLLKERKGRKRKARWKDL